MLSLFRIAFSMKKICNIALTFFKNLTMNHIIMQHSMKKYVWMLLWGPRAESELWKSLHQNLKSLPTSRFHNELKIIGNLGPVKNASEAASSMKILHFTLETSNQICELNNTGEELVFKMFTILSFPPRNVIEDR